MLKWLDCEVPNIINERLTMTDPIITETFAPLEQLGLDGTLNERGSRYGSFIGHAQITQDLKDVIYEGLREREKTLSPDQYEALDMICHKIGRIINGDPDYADSWHDIAGYASLVDKRLNGEIK